MPDLERSLATLPDQLESLSEADRQRFDALFSVILTHGDLIPPPEMRAWLEGAFGSAEAVRSQTIVKVLNRWTLDGALFNDLRGRRPMPVLSESAIPGLESDGSDPFCHPLTETPADTFGRVQGAYSVTGSNVAKYDGLHAVIVMSQHNPLALTQESLSDGLETARRWLEEAHRERPSAVYPFFMWNCLPKSGASQMHAHMQVALGEGIAYAKPERWRRAGIAYRQQHARNYFDDFYAAHESLGLAGSLGQGVVRWLAHLTPIKEKELILVGPSMGQALYEGLYEALRLYIDVLGVRAFNVAFYMPPLGPTEEDWTGFPLIVRMVDRGNPASATVDVGAMELFAQSVVAFDPWRLAKLVREAAAS